MPRKILLIEPNYKNKYPPIGLMKISTYHKMQNDKVEFFKGDLRHLLLDLKLRKCLEKLSTLFSQTNWHNHADLIRQYLSSKKLIFLNKIKAECRTDDDIQLETTLRHFSNHAPNDYWDRIYITTLFTFYWDITIKTIQFAKRVVDNNSKIFVGGVMASLLNDEIFNETQIKPFAGLLDRPGILDVNNQLIVDELPLDYSILEEIEYKYPTDSAYFTFMTKGCTRKCAFCSVPKLEPTYKNKIESIKNFEIVNNRFGEQRNLLLMDNNVLASPKFPQIIEEIKSMGFIPGATFQEPNQLEICISNLQDSYNDKGYLTKATRLIYGLTKRLKGNTLLNYKNALIECGLNGHRSITKDQVYKVYNLIKHIYEKHRSKSISKRYVDFNQGTDARYVTDSNMRLMSEIPIKPLRIAFDHIGIKNTYIAAVELAAKYGISDLSNYILYNFHDKPEHLYERLKLNVDLGKRLNVKIFSFPMKYIPLFGEEAKHRKYIGTNWTRKFIRAIQCILNASKGIVAPGSNFFYMAFGNSLDEFMELLWMPEAYIINRIYFQESGMTRQWREDFAALDESEKTLAKDIINNALFISGVYPTINVKILRLLSHYSFFNDDKMLVSSQVKKLRNKYNRIIKNDRFINLTLTHDFDSSKNFLNLR